MNTLEKYLPIGSVVMLKGGTKRVMIIGFGAVTENDKNTVWDYSACLYPEGVLSSTQSCLFNHDQIEKIYHLGLIDADEIEFKKQFDELMENLEKVQKENLEQNSQQNIEQNNEAE